MDTTGLTSSPPFTDFTVSQKNQQYSSDKSRALGSADAAEPTSDRISLSKTPEPVSADKTTDNDKNKEYPASSDSVGGTRNFSSTEIQEIRELKQRDVEVRNHEQAHYTAAGRYAAGQASYSYEVGPDGKRYAVEGEVPIDINKEATPEQTLEKMQQVERAALAPQNPSAADRRIAARASAIAAEARKDISGATAADSVDEHEGTPSDEEDSVTYESVTDVHRADGQLSHSSSNQKELALKAYRALA